MTSTRLLCMVVVRTSEVYNTHMNVLVRRLRLLGAYKGPFRSKIRVSTLKSKYSAVFLEIVGLEINWQKIRSSPP